MDAGHAHPKVCAATAPRAVGDPALRDGSRNGDPPDGQQFLEVELQPDAEHQQDHADFRELLGEVGVGDEAGRIGSDDDAGQQVADDGRQSQALRDVAEEQRRAESRSRASG